MTTIINGSSPSITFSDSTTQATAAPYGPAFSAYQSTFQSTTSGVYTKIQFQTKEFDTNNFYDNSTNYRFTPTVAGYYQVSGAVSYYSNVSSLQTVIYKNGSAYRTGYNASGTSGTGQVSALVYCNGSTDYIELYSVQTQGTVNTYNVIQYTYFQAAMIRSA
jgi:hypothetical protein